MDVLKWVRAQWDRVAAWAAIAAGAIVLFVGWLGVSRTAYPAEQIPYIVSAGLGGIFLVGLGATLWISADLRDEWRKLDRIEEALLGGELADRAVAEPNGAAAPRPAVESGEGLGEPGDDVAEVEPTPAPRRRRRVSRTS